MNDVVLRAAVVVAVLGLAWLIAVGFRRFVRPSHPDLTVGDVGDRPGVVMFTSTDCTTCKEAIRRIENVGVAFREVTYELEPQRFDTWGVGAVPLTVVLAEDSSIVSVMTGVPSDKQFRRDIARAGIEVGA